MLKINSQNWQKYSKNTLATQLAEVLSELNAIHPFREGNGRSQRTLVSMLASQARYQVHWYEIETNTLLDAMIQSFVGDKALLTGLLDKHIKPITYS